MSAPYDARFQCEVFSIVYSFITRSGTLIVEDGNCPDMDGCIGAFAAIDPLVTEVDVHTTNMAAINHYRKTRSGWLAVSTSAHDHDLQ